MLLAGIGTRATVPNELMRAYTQHPWCGAFAVRARHFFRLFLNTKGQNFAYY